MLEKIEKVNNCTHSVFRPYFGEYECKIHHKLIYSSIHCESCAFFEDVNKMKNISLDYTGFEDCLDFLYSDENEKRYTFIFDNGYGASVIINKYSYGNKQGLFELAVLKKASEGLYELTYDTPIANDVIGYLTSEDVKKYLKQIREFDEGADILEI